MNLSTEAKMSEKNSAAGDTSSVRKFMFDRSFDDAAVVHRAPERKPVLMKPEQIDALKKESYDLGFTAGVAANQEEKNSYITALISKIDHNINVLLQNITAIVSEHEDLTRHLVLVITKKILPTFITQSGTMEVEALVNETVREMAREPRLVVRVSESEFDALNERIQAIAAQQAYPGKIIVLADANVMSGDCRIEWPDGGIERTVQSTLSNIEKTILPTT